MWFVVVVVLVVGLSNGDGIVTVAREVDSQEDCEEFIDHMRNNYPAKFRKGICTQYTENKSGDGG